MGNLDTNPALTETILTEWAKGKSAGIIARELRVSRNCVIGRVHRARQRSNGEGGPARRKKTKHATGYKENSSKQIKPRRAGNPTLWLRNALYPQSRKIKRVENPVPLPFIILPFGNRPWHAENGCCYLNDQYLWCNAPVFGKSSWCEFHHGIVFNS